MTIQNSKYHSKPKLLDQVSRLMQRRDYSPRTIKTYTSWIKRFIIHNNKIHPLKLGEKQVSKFLTFLAVERTLRKSRITKHGSTHTLRRSFATHLLEDGYDIPIQELLCHKSVKPPCFTHTL